MNNKKKINFIKNKEVIPDTHFLVYLDKKYPIKFDFFKYASNYFSQNKDELSKTINIQLFPDDLESNVSINPNTIEQFIDFVQSKKIPVDNENVVELHYLSERFEVTTLYEKTKEYIKIHQKELILKLLYQHQKDSQIDLTTYEDIISTNIQDYIDDEIFLKLPIPMIYRILIRSINHHNKDQKRDQKFTEKLNSFIFKCLDERGIEASVLFENNLFFDGRKEYVNLLLTKYSDRFDFQYINSIIIDTLKETQNEERKIREQYEQAISEQKIMKEQYEHAISEERKKREQCEQTISEQKIQIKKHQEEIKSNNLVHSNKMKEITSKHQTLQEELTRERVERTKQNEQLKTCEEKIGNQIKQIKELEQKLQQIQEQQQVQNIRRGKSVITLTYNPQSEFDGIIKYLTNKTGGNIHDNGTINVACSSYFLKHEPKYLLDFNYNSCYQAGQDNNATVCFDFKEKKIKMTHYSIKSFSRDKNKRHLKSWIIEVSNDGTHWTTIDERKNCSTLNGRCLTGTFEVEPNNFSRYIRLHQTDETWQGNGIYVVLYYLEFYGYLEE